ncbi:MAG: CoB--CoM heterodisulfide reductase iron-sulfur subunit B family protein [Clostridia bacterium]|nr:CoB--CoM heterodisulfide reductase iron-sulfur subunit B family protein [Clostridia bacterium]
MTYSYYPGCTLKTKAKELDRQGRLSAAALGVELEEIENWQCCGAVYPQASDEIATKLSAIRALDAAKQKGQPLLTLCSACHHVIKRVNHDMLTDEDLRLKANNYLQLEEPYLGEAQVVHYLEMLRDQVGFDALKKAVKNPFKGVKIAAYYGCLLLRPSGVMAFDDPENPTIIEDFIRAIGATPVPYSQRNECCGGYITLEDRPAAQKRVDAIVKSAMDAGAEVIITACPLCMYNLSANATAHKLPVKYFTELLYEALGLEKKEGE